MTRAAAATGESGPMRPTRAQRLVARNLPGTLLLWTGTIAISGCLALALLPFLLFEPGAWSILRFAFMLIVAVPLAFLVSLVAASIVIPPMYHWRGRLNGAPYAVGDHVRILAGSYLGRVVRVLHPRPESDAVIVVLGEQDGEPITEYLGTFQVCRERG